MGIKTATFQLEVQCLNQLHHRKAPQKNKTQCKLQPLASKHYSTCHVTLSTTFRSCVCVVAETAADTLHCTVSSETFCSLNKRILHNAHHLQITHACCVHDDKSAHKCAIHTDTTPWTQSEAWSSAS
jgi:hypothetical protein